MDIDRRKFFKVAGVTGIALATGKRLVAQSEPVKQTELYGILYDATKCEGCGYCELACADANDLQYPEDSPESGVSRNLSPENRTIVNVIDTFKGPVSVKTQCMHCNEPACATACLTQAMHKTVEGPVIWREDKCMGCRYCMVSCPFDIPKFEYDSTNPKIQKCTMCFELIKKREIPSCVLNCPNEAMIYGKRRDLIAKARKRIYESPNDYVDYIYGEHEAGGTGWLYLSPVPFKELGLKTNLQNSSYPSLTKGFISAIAPVDILLPALLLGVHEATKSKKNNEEDQI